MRLAPDDVMDWHSTGLREELIIALSGSLRLECRQSSNRISRTAVRAGECAFIPSRTWHRVLNASTRAGRYIYVTG